jgi:small conductance mechanosensitive channel
MSSTQKIIQKFIEKLQNEDMWLAMAEGLIKIIAILVICKILIKI